MAMSTTVPILTDDTIREAMQRAERAVCPPGDQRCYGFPYDVKSALGSQTPDGWCLIGWVAADSGRKSWDAWDNIRTGEGRLRKQADAR